ncbi:Transcription termination factor [Gracilaria domingensis]|nr:Transcription termination factor [Gracilaria domingensis]
MSVSSAMAFVNGFAPRHGSAPSPAKALICLRRPRSTFRCCSAPPASPQKPRTNRDKSHITDAHRELAEKFLRSLGLSVEESRRLPARLPKLRRADLPVFAEPTLAYLRSLGLGARQIARAVRHAPQIFFRPRGQFAARLQFMDSVARIPEANVASVISKCPHVLWMDVNNAAQVVENIMEECPRMSVTTLGEVFSSVPQALLSRPNAIQENLNAIRQAGVSDTASMSRVVAKAPVVLVKDMKKCLPKRLNYLCGELGFPTKTVGKILVCTPELLDWSVEKELVPKVKLLQSLVGDEHVAAAVDKVPSIFATDDILDRVLWLRDEVGLSEEQVQSVLREAPAILTYSVVGNLAPKWTFIHETMGASIEELVAAPREMLCANLQQRAMPRYAFLASSGKRDVSVVDVLRGNDVDFCRNVAKCDTKVFRNYVDNDTYLLFFSRLM